MAYGEAAQRTTYRTRPRAFRAALALIALAVLVAVATRLLAGEVELDGNGSRSIFSRDGWPQGQAAIALGGGEPEVSPDQQPAPIASLAKVMTAYLTLERYPLSDGENGFTITVSSAQARAVSEDAAEGESVVPVLAGERLNERQLLEALLIPSGNNIARLLAARVAGDEADFVAAMNAEARDLGMDQTTYTDPSGFDAGTVSTAADQLRVFRQAIGFPVFREIVSMPAASLPVAGTLTNFNPLLADGYFGKTGSDSAAGGCLSFFTRVVVGGHGRTAVGVVMGQGDGSDTSALLAAAGEAAERLVASVGGTGDGGKDASRPLAKRHLGAVVGAPPMAAP